MSSLAEKIKNTIILSEFISKTLKIKIIHKGQRSWICCPFHHEKTASLAIYDSKRFFYCFGCGKNGDIFTFVTEYNHTTFQNAVRILCEYLNIPFKFNEKYTSNEYIYNLLNDAHTFYKTQIQFNSTAQEYIKSRHLEDYEEIGYSPNHEIIDFLLKKGYRREQIENSGICNLQGHDRLSNRIIFPIYCQNKIVGFAGRSIDDRKPKYINFPETEVFHKQICLFNDQTVNLSQKTVIVEGYIDAIQIHKHTQYNGISVMGTNISPEQLLKTLNINKNIYIMFDNDSAGDNAILKNLNNILSVIRPGDNVNICKFLPNNIHIKDADDAINMMYPEYIEECVNKSTPLSQWIYNYIYENSNRHLPEYHAQQREMTEEVLNNITDPNVRISYKSFLYNRKQQNIRSKETSRNSIYEKEDCLIKILRKFPIVWINNFEMFNKYQFRNKTYGKINDLLNSTFLQNANNYDFFIQESQNIFNRYLISDAKYNDLSDTITSEKFADFYVKDIICSLL